MKSLKEYIRRAPVWRDGEPNDRDDELALILDVVIEAMPAVQQAKVKAAFDKLEQEQ